MLAKESNELSYFEGDYKLMRSIIKQAEEKAAKRRGCDHNTDE